MIGVELVDPDAAAPDALVPPPAPALAAAVQQECLAADSSSNSADATPASYDCCLL